MPFTAEDPEPTQTMYAELGKFVAVTLGTYGEAWWADDILQDIDHWLGQHWGYAQHPGNPATFERWSAIKDEAEHRAERARAAAKKQIEEEKNG
jgi:hypothetical protein